MTRRTVLSLPAAALMPALSRAAAGPVRRALVIGINAYTPLESTEHLSASAVGADARPKTLRGNFQPLDGAVNDALLMRQLLRDRFDFAAENITLLTNGQATRDRILQQFRICLIDGATAGDTCLFYYAGHGSQVKNTGSEEADQLDETIVPVDVSRGARDIRDKEMVRLYRAAAEKGVALTVVLDSCHSGGMARGVWNRGGKSRYAPADPRAVNDPPDRDPKTGRKLPDPASMGVLFLFAARDDQSAQETTVIERGRGGEQTSIPHGAFTAALAKVLQSSSGNDSVEQISNRTQAILASQGKIQVPICAGKDRKQRGLLGQDAGSGGTTTVTIRKVKEDGSVEVQGGSALGLSPGCTLSRSGGAPARIELIRVDLASAEGKLAGAAETAVQPGDVFKLDGWVAPPSGGLKVYVCKSGPAASATLAVGQVLARLAARGEIELLPELTPGKPPTHVLHWESGGYLLERVPASGELHRLGPTPAVEDLLRALHDAGPVTLWAMLPPDPAIASSLRLGDGSPNPAVHVVDRPSDAVYLLAGRAEGGTLQYSWVFKDTLGLAPDAIRLPVQTDWKDSGEQLTAIAVRLAHVYNWLTMVNPPGDGRIFPYRLGFEKAGTGQIATTRSFKIGEEYKFVFVAEPNELRQADESGGLEKRYVYVFLIDSNGQGSCLFPDPADGNEGNLVPRGSEWPARLEATRAPSDLGITPPAGRDNYFMVTSRTPLDPGIFDWKGVRTEPVKRGSESELELLFSSAGEGRRGAAVRHAVPVGYSIESVTIQSVL